MLGVSCSLWGAGGSRLGARLTSGMIVVMAWMAAWLWWRGGLVSVVSLRRPRRCAAGGNTPVGGLLMCCAVCRTGLVGGGGVHPGRGGHDVEGPRRGRAVVLQGEQVGWRQTHSCGYVAASCVRGGEASWTGRSRLGREVFAWRGGDCGCPAVGVWIVSAVLCVALLLSCVGSVLWLLWQPTSLPWVAPC